MNEHLKCIEEIIKSHIECEGDCIEVKALRWVVGEVEKIEGLMSEYHQRVKDIHKLEADLAKAQSEIARYEGIEKENKELKFIFNRIREEK